MGTHHGAIRAPHLPIGNDQGARGWKLIFVPVVVSSRLRRCELVPLKLSCMTKEDIAVYLMSLIAPIAPGTTCEFVSDDMGTLFTVTVPADNKGRVIGRSGETIKAIRHIVGLVGFQVGIRASVKV